MKKRTPLRGLSGRCVVSVFFFLLLSVLSAFGQDIEPFPEFSSQDKVLILAPHPDDEAIAASGVIQDCVRRGIPVKIVYFTNGDNNELSFIVYEKRIVFKKKAFVSMGELRRKEALNAMKYLGLKEEDLVFLGYPDFGTLEIFLKYWDAQRPFRSMLTRVTRVPYASSFSSGAPYVGQSILGDLKRVLLSFEPTRILVSHPADTNRDHRALNLFLHIALWDLKEKIATPQVYPYLVHVVGWPMPRGFRPALKMEPPKVLDFPDSRWLNLKLSEQEVWTKRQAISFYRSQIRYAPSYLYSFARGNELFGNYPAVRLARQPGSLRWQDVRMEPDAGCEGAAKTQTCRLSYALDGDDLLVRLALRNKFKKNFGIFLYLCGYSPRAEFAGMPKIRISIGMRGVHVWDKLRRVQTKDVKASYEGHSLIVRVPLRLLGEPDRVLARVKASTKDLPFDNTAWHCLLLEE